MHKCIWKCKSSPKRLHFSTRVPMAIKFVSFVNRYNNLVILQGPNKFTRKITYHLKKNNSDPCKSLRFNPNVKSGIKKENYSRTMSLWNLSPRNTYLGSWVHSLQTWFKENYNMLACLVVQKKRKITTCLENNSIALSHTTTTSWPHASASITHGPNKKNNTVNDLSVVPLHILLGSV